MMASPGRLFILSAPSGTGKSTVGRLVREHMPQLEYSVSLTTRAPRPGEKEGEDYHFVSREQFQAKVAAGEMAEWAEVCGNLYGTSAKVLAQALDQGRHILLDIDVQGARQLRQRFSQAVFIFLQPPSMGELERRLRGRGTEDDQAIAARLAQAQNEMQEAQHYDFQVVNDDLARAVVEVITIIRTWGGGAPR